MKNNEFKIPNNYFDKFEDKILKSTKNLKISEAFLVPINYFENIESSVLEKIKKRKKRIFYLKTFSIAATFLLFISLFTLYKNKNNTIKQSDIINYLSENMESDEIDEIVIEKNVYFKDQIITDKEILNYMEENDITDEELYNNI